MNVLKISLTQNNVGILFYLFGVLSGKAVSVFSGISPTGGNYNIIWKEWIDKFEDERLLANTNNFRV